MFINPLLYKLALFKKGRNQIISSKSFFVKLKYSPMEWIIENKEWIFSGVGVSILTMIVNALFQKWHKGNNDTVIKSGNKAVINGNNNETSQVGSNFIEVNGDKNKNNQR